MPPLPAAAPLAPEVIAVRGEIYRWIEPWYGAYAILGALASGFASIAIPLVIAGDGGTAATIGEAVAALNIGALFAPLWGILADYSRAYRAIFFAGFVLIGGAFLGFTFLQGRDAWLVLAFLLGFGVGASNTVASLFVVEFTAKSEWTQRIGWLQTFNALGSVAGMALAGLIEPRVTTAFSALLVIPAIILGGRGLPVPGGPLHLFPRGQLPGGEILHLLRRGGPNALAVVAHLHSYRWSDIRHLAQAGATPFGKFLLGWLLFSLAVSSFAALYPVLMAKSFDFEVSRSSMLMSVATAMSIPLYNIAGRLASRFGAGLTLVIGVAVRVIALGGLASVAYLHPDETILLVVVLYGIFQGIWPLLSVASNDLGAALAPFGAGAAMGLFNAMGAIGSALGALAGGEVADYFGYPAASLFATFVALLSLLCIIALRRSGAGAEPAPLKPH
jgi:MFS family permease